MTIHLIPILLLLTSFQTLADISIIGLDDKGNEKKSSMNSKGFERYLKNGVDSIRESVEAIPVASKNTSDKWKLDKIYAGVGAKGQVKTPEIGASVKFQFAPSFYLILKRN